MNFYWLFGYFESSKHSLKHVKIVTQRKEKDDKREKSWRRNVITVKIKTKHNFGTELFHKTTKRILNNLAIAVHFLCFFSSCRFHSATVDKNWKLWASNGSRQSFVLFFHSPPSFLIAKKNKILTKTKQTGKLLKY